MFEDFKLERIDTGQAVLRGRHGGSGPAVLLLHGHPRTHVTWHRVARYTATAEHMGVEAYQDYRRAIHDPDTVHAMMEDYRAGLGLDRQHDEADRGIGCPLLFLWAARDDLEDLYGDPLAIWRDWADDVRGQSLDCGHHLAEEAPEELAALLAGFFAPA